MVSGYVPDRWVEKFFSEDTMMINAAFIPVRGGSKSIPLKNIKPICGRPLVYWTLRAACECSAIDRVYVATDSDKIRRTVLAFKTGEEAALFAKTEVISRSAESASDTASTEFAMLEFAEKYEFDNIVLIQATSPLLRGTDLDRGFAAFAEPGTDSVLSVVPQKRFHWANDAAGYAHPTNYDVFHRPRRQEFDGYLVENGAFYITSKADLLASKNRVSGNIKAVEMREDTFFEIDEPSDWIVIEALMKKNGLDALGQGAATPEVQEAADQSGSGAGTQTSALQSANEVQEAAAPSEPGAGTQTGGFQTANERQALPKIRMFLTDCDGCLTDAGMYYSEKGDELKKFNTRDGMGFSILRGKGIVTGIVTSEDVDLNRRRAEKLKLDILESGCKDKPQAVRRICAERGIDLSQVTYVGDDSNDLEVIRMVGFGCAPADALPQVRQAADFVAEAKGGNGAIREIIEYMLEKGMLEP